LSSEVFIRGFISSLPQRAWDKKALLLLLLLLLLAGHVSSVLTIMLTVSFVDCSS
jgi:hypothetical protein